MAVGVFWFLIGKQLDDYNEFGHIVSACCNANNMFLTEYSLRLIKNSDSFMKNKIMGVKDHQIAHLISTIVGKNNFSATIESIQNIIDYKQHSGVYSSDTTYDPWYNPLNEVVLKEYILSLDNSTEKIQDEISLEMLFECVRFAQRKADESRNVLGKGSFLYVVLSNANKQLLKPFAQGYKEKMAPWGYGGVQFDVDFLLSLIAEDLGQTDEKSKKEKNISDVGYRKLMTKADWYVKVDKKLELKQLCDEYDAKITETAFMDLKKDHQTRFKKVLKRIKNGKTFMQWAYNSWEDRFEASLAHIKKEVTDDGNIVLTGPEFHTIDGNDHETARKDRENDAKWHYDKKLYHTLQWSMDYIIKHGQLNVNEIINNVNYSYENFVAINYDMIDFLVNKLNIEPTHQTKQFALTQNDKQLLEIFGLTSVRNKVIDTVRIVHHTYERKDENENKGKLHMVEVDEKTFEINSNDWLKKQKKYVEKEKELFNLYSIKSREISNKTFENWLIYFYQNYIESNSSDSELKIINGSNNETITTTRGFLLNNIILAKKYLYNQNFSYRIESKNNKNFKIINIDKSNNKCGLCLFHSILRNDSLTSLYSKIAQCLNDDGDINNVNGVIVDFDKNTLYLSADGNSQLSIECIVFGSYNVKYESCKYGNNIKKYTINDFTLDKNKEHYKLIKLLHQTQFDTISLKMNNIV